MGNLIKMKIKENIIILSISSLLTLSLIFGFFSFNPNIIGYTIYSKESIKSPSPLNMLSDLSIPTLIILFTILYFKYKNSKNEKH